MTLAASGTVASIVPFDPTFGIAVVASVMLAVFVLGMAAFALAPVFSSWGGQTSEAAAAATPDAEPSDD